MTYLHLPRAFAFCPWEDRILCCHSCWPSTCPEGNLGLKMRHFVLQRNYWNRSSDSYFQELISSWAPQSLQTLTAAMKLRHLLLWRKAMTNLESILKSRDITLPTKVHLVKALVFPVFMYGCENWTMKKAEVPKNWCFWTVVLEKILESPLDRMEIKPVNPKGNLSWIFIWRSDAEAKT